jgi:purine-nucleoside phosphorylase
MIDLNFKYSKLIQEIKTSAPFKPHIALILGSGLGNFIEMLNVIKSISTESLNDYPVSTISGHAGYIHFAEYAQKKILIFQGRIHLYEGYKIYECILPVFITYKLECNKLIITNAAGGINPSFNPGDLMLSTSVNGINIKKELTNFLGIASKSGKDNFFNFPSPQLNAIIKNSAKSENLELQEGLYWYTKGPSYETPAEVKMIQKFGGDAVGMSTVHEAVYAAYLGINTSALSVITNYASGISNKKLTHSDVTETALFVKEKFEKLLKAVIKRV